MSSEGRAANDEVDDPAPGARRRLARRALDWAEVADGPPDLDDDQRANLALAEACIHARDVRARMLGGTVQFADPAWDILLDLYVGALRGRMIAISDACIAARVPMTTAFRWIEHLVRTGVVERNLDPTDGRRILVRLTAAQLSVMDDFFRTLSGSLSLSDANPRRSSIKPRGR